MKISKAEYKRVHEWIKKNCGKAWYCHIDRQHKATRYHWANLSRQYKYEKTDWLQMCASCHYLFDLKNISITEFIALQRNKKKFISAMNRGKFLFRGACKIDYRKPQETKKTEIVAISTRENILKARFIYAQTL